MNGMTDLELALLKARINWENAVLYGEEDVEHAKEALVLALSAAREG